MRAINTETGEMVFVSRWNLNAMSELVVGYLETGGGMDSVYAKDWVCACHGLPIKEADYGQAVCAYEGEYYGS